MIRFILVTALTIASSSYGMGGGGIVHTEVTSVSSPSSDVSVIDLIKSWLFGE